MDAMSNQRLGTLCVLLSVLALHQIPCVKTDSVSLSHTASVGVLNSTSSIELTSRSTDVDVNHKATHTEMDNGDLEVKITPSGTSPTETVADRLHFVMSAIVGPIICIPGIVGNILSIITWCRPGMTSSTGRYLTGQAVADLGVLVMFLSCDSMQYWVPAVKYSQAYGVFFSYIGYPLLFLAVVCSVWVTVGVTIDRYIMVCWITKSKTFCSETRAVVGLVLIAINAFFINLPHFASYTVVYPEDGGNQTSEAFTLTEFGAGPGGMFYEFWVHCIILILIPWVTVLTLNILIVREITASNRRMIDKKTRESIKKSKQSEAQITRLLLVVTFSFLIFIGLQCIIQCLWMQKPPWADMQIVSGTFAFGKTGIIFNSSMNFVLYCMTGRRFRKELLKILGCRQGEAQLSSIKEFSSSSGSGSTHSGKSFATTSTTGFTSAM